jgi:hypothetical protein
MSGKKVRTPAPAAVDGFHVGSAELWCTFSKVCTCKPFFHYSPPSGELAGSLPAATEVVNREWTRMNTNGRDNECLKILARREQIERLQ